MTDIFGSDRLEPVSYHQKQSHPKVIMKLSSLQKFIPPLLLLIFFSLSISSMTQKSAAYDESSHLPSGYLYLKSSDFSFYNHNPPLIKMLAAMPLLAMDINLDIERYAQVERPEDIGLEFMKANRENYEKIFFAGRLVILIIALFGGLIVFLWSKKMYGDWAGYMALFLYALSPNILAHSHFVTSDLGCSVFILASLYFFFRWLENELSVSSMILAAVVLGCAQLTKFSALPLYGILTIYFFYYYFKHGLPKKSILSLAAIFLISILVLNAGYFFDGTFTPIGIFNFKSHLLSSIQNLLPASLPIPLPYEYVAGFDGTQDIANNGNFYQFLMGARSSSGWWYYYPVAFLFKVPIAFLAALALLIFMRFKEKLKEFRDDEVLMLIMLFFYAVSFILTITVNIGLRYMLPLWPVLHILVSRLATFKLKDNIRYILLSLLLLFYAVATLNVHPHYLSFFNSLAGGPKNGYKYLIDSNIDWGQDLLLLKKYMDENDMEVVYLAYFGTVDPNVYGINFIPLSKKHKGVRAAVSVNYYQGHSPRILFKYVPYYMPPEYYLFLHNYPIVDRIGHSLLIIDIPSD